MKTRLGLTTLVLLLLGGHVLYWYTPRERAAAPRAGDLPGRVLTHGALPVRLWIPYPHQNLGSLAERVDRPQEALEAAARLAGLPAPVLPSFGPFAVPPARELAAAFDRQGQRFLIVARIYPVMALIARAAGLVAGNPWLKGGVVRSSGRDARVGWQGSLWILSTEEIFLPETVPPEPSAPALARLSLAEAVPPLPAGLYVLDRSGGDLRLRRDAGSPQGQRPNPPPPKPRGPSPRLGPNTALLVARGIDGSAGATPCAVVLFHVLDSRGEGVVRLPSAAVLYRPGEERWSLPGEGVLSLVGARLYREEAGVWSIAALDAHSLEQARGLAPVVSELLSGREGESLVLGLWLDPRRTWDFARRMRQVLEGVPLVPAQTVRYWRDLEALLAPLTGLESVSVESLEETFELRLWGGRGS